MLLSKYLVQKFEKCCIGAYFKQTYNYIFVYRLSAFLKLNVFFPGHVIYYKVVLLFYRSFSNLLYSILLIFKFVSLLTVLYVLQSWSSFTFFFHHSIHSLESLLAWSWRIEPSVYIFSSSALRKHDFPISWQLQYLLIALYFRYRLLLYFPIISLAESFSYVIHLFS